MTSAGNRVIGATLAAVCAGRLAAVPAANAAPAVSGQLLVGFEKGVSKADQQRILATADGRLAQRFEAVRTSRRPLPARWRSAAA
jgi:hypothetical protein